MVWISNCSTWKIVSLLLLSSLVVVLCEHPRTKYALGNHHDKSQLDEHARFVIKFRESVQEYHKKQFTEDHQLEEEHCIGSLPHWMQFRAPSERTEELLIKLKQDPRIEKWNHLKKKQFHTRSITFSDPLYRSENGSPSRGRSSTLQLTHLLQLPNSWTMLESLKLGI